MLFNRSVSMLFFCLLLHPGATAMAEIDERPRARDIGLVVGTFKTGPLNAITDVEHVRVGHVTRIDGEDIRTGDYVIAFSTNQAVRRPRSSRHPVTTTALVNESMSPLFAATAEATEEAIYNAILKATTVESSRGRLEAIPLEETLKILQKYNALDWDETLPPAGR